MLRCSLRWTLELQWLCTLLHILNFKAAAVLGGKVLSGVCSLLAAWALPLTLGRVEQGVALKLGRL